eukprot:NODE_125_length_17255_cov_0.877827.p3 type:complete len:508 gc:universal NODE_125_length_17255_cov_0.877827:16083-14560(-)
MSKIVKNCVQMLKPVRPMPLNHPDFTENESDPLVDGFSFPKMKNQKRVRNKRLNYDPSIPFTFMFLSDFYNRNGLEIDEQLDPFGEPVNIDTEIKILEISPSGNSGVGIHFEQAVLVPFVALGDIVKVNIYRDCQMYFKAKITEVVKPAPLRVSPPCQYFGKCAGCQLQHIPYDEQLRLKWCQVKDAFSRLDIDTPVNSPIRSPREYRYRTKLTPHYDKPRDLEMADLPIGFNYFDSRKVLDVEECSLGSESMNSTYSRLRLEVKAKIEKPKMGATLLLREGTKDSWDINSYDEMSYVISDPKSEITINVNEIQFSLTSNSFFQNNSVILPDFVNFVKSQINTKILLDTYCGVGLFALCCAQKVEHVYGIEVARNFIENAIQNAVDNNITNCTFIEGSAEAIFSKITAKPEDTTVIMDPPRKGSTKAYLDQLMDFGPKTIIYIACGLYAQVRDVRYIMNGIWFDYVSNFDKDFRVDRPKYTILTIQPVDLFPQTNHVESIIVFNKCE